MTAKPHKRSLKWLDRIADNPHRGAVAPDSNMNCGSQFVENEIRQTETAEPGARILSFEGRDLRDSLPVAPLETDQDERYDLICVDNISVDHLVERIRNGRARELLAELFSAVSPGGRLLIGGSAEADEEQLAHLSARIPEREIAGQVIVRDQSGAGVFLELYKRAA